MTQFKFSERVPADGTDAVGAILQAAADPKIISFAGGLPAPELFPVKEMKAAVDKVFEEHGQEAMQYGAAKGVTALREVIQQHVKEKENVDSELDNVLVTTGSEQVLDLVGKAFVDPGDTVLVEQPTYLCALDVFRSYGANFASVEMDEDGMKMDALEEALKANPNTKLIYTVPNFQNPTGRTMTEERRKQLAELAEKYDVYILEDNPYGEIRFVGEHVPAVKAFDKSGHVLYMSTFSKTLAPGFRLGWLVADEDVVNKLTVLKQSADLHTDNLAQFAVAQFFADNDVDAHVKEISNLYGKRKDLMLEGIKKYFPEGVKYTDPEGGMFLWVEVPGVDDTVELFKECLEHNVAFVPGDPFFASEVQPGAFRLNYSNMKEDQIEVGLKRLGAALTAAVNK
ncbi:PLP-dependent aminotransferase family protein [Limosilactobacillus agrestis]|uniref:PLP-dependent aminotransferase family protein n=1 Tax=Limosilactobacillus agrestis TaxID=2759748 RepID=A0A7W3UJ01_9LACO|nr:PLP-dependent aminotransferase family protein [Limosilactobacillus agrestis]MBB1095875.1 PLP-dependent aminotransferase family protein [Limosilactobacillus agrestis]MBB1098922.1 PLP-dependent aminotransferase family protein [Limosilactobacillus agrestis]MCD7112407.1 PLP-dependent aminotransferase family protein [Limosilactobacillus agrestis]MCD7119603.1 PLP-dependent aminotransferase family protein [Limosilactobacillus agrestis]MCD7125648.1 PLP-dependent aminotransferase family protein [Lim